MNVLPRQDIIPIGDSPKNVRVSLGSAIVLGLLRGKLDAEPTTAYLMTYRRGKCLANCSFCPQARMSRGRSDMLSRVSWPAFTTKSVINGIEKAFKAGKIKRVCLQALNYPEVFKHLTALIKMVRKKTSVQISVSCQPADVESIRLLAEAGAERISIPLDAATPEIFDKVKGLSAGGPYRWERQFELLSGAIKVFGRGKVNTHLIVGLGETEREMVKIIQQCVDMGVLPALFAFTPISGALLEDKPQPSIQSYRRIQTARYLIVNGVTRYENLNFDGENLIRDFGVDAKGLLKIIQTGEPFRTSGCPNCNRPYYNEKPSGPIYNYPRPLKEEEIAQAILELGI